MLIYESTKRLVDESLYPLVNRNMSTPIARFSESTLKWRKICEKIFGSRHGFTWRLNPNDGKIYFSKNGIELIKANAFIVATTWITDKTKLNWLWAWGRTKNRQLIMDKLSEDNRFTTADVAEYDKDLGEYKSYFQKNAFQLDLAKKSDQITESQLRAYTLDILDGQYVYEAEIGYGSGRMNVIFVIAGAKSIKQKVPTQESQESSEPHDSERLEKQERPETEKQENQNDQDSDSDNDASDKPVQKSQSHPEKDRSEKKSTKSTKSEKQDNPDEWDW